MEQLTKWYERPLICMLGFHYKVQHPGIEHLWYCQRCRFEGIWRDV